MIKANIFQIKAKLSEYLDRASHGNGFSSAGTAGGGTGCR
jgi:hypothetical protein